MDDLGLSILMSYILPILLIPLTVASYVPQLTKLSHRQDTDGWNGAYLYMSVLLSLNVSALMAIFYLTDNYPILPRHWVGFPALLNWMQCIVQFLGSLLIYTHWARYTEEDILASVSAIWLVLCTFASAPALVPAPQAGNWIMFVLLQMVGTVWTALFFISAVLQVITSFEADDVGSVSPLSAASQGVVFGYLAFSWFWRIPGSWGEWNWGWFGSYGFAMVHAGIFAVTQLLIGLRCASLARRDDMKSHYQDDDERQVLLPGCGIER